MGNFRLHNNTYISRICANTYQSFGTIYQNTCLSNNLPKMCML